MNHITSSSDEDIAEAAHEAMAMAEGLADPDLGADEDPGGWVH